jgi:indole-3-glycerol phosphate synthase
MDILQEIVAWKRLEVARHKEVLPPGVLHQEVDRLLCEEESLRSRGELRNPDTRVPVTRFSLRQALQGDAFGIVAEFKRRSPSKGWIKEDGRPEVIPPSYAANGAAALSILTDEKYFGGSDKFLRTARPLVDIPILYKNFIVDEYQLFEARAAGADAVLLIAADLSKDECRSLTTLAHDLQMEVLLETHSEPELEYVECEPDVVGINNRNLGTFHTDVQNSFRLSALLPTGYVRISESGISNPLTVKRLRLSGFQGFLIGENFMKAANPGAALKEFIEELK